MKKIFFTIGLFLFTSVFLIKAQECTFYIPVSVGTVTEVKNYNAKDKVTGSVKSTVIEQTANSVKFNSEIYDDKEKVVSKGEYEVLCKNGEYVIDMNSLLSGVNKDAYKDMEVQVVTTEMTMPSKLQIGQLLNDGSINMKVINQGLTLMNMNVNVTNRKVEGFEDVTTPAGSFKCTKISYDVETKMMMTAKTKIIEWVSEKVGVVRSESYNQKGKLVAYSVLSSIKQL